MSSPQARPTIAQSLTTMQRRALLCLLQAFENAYELQQDTWQFAPQLPQLRAEGISSIVLRHLVAQGLAVHGRETTQPTAQRRSVRPLAHLQFSEQSCFVLADGGLALARALTRQDEICPQDGRDIFTAVAELPSPRPSFVSCEDGRRELRLRYAVVKRYWKPGANQELVLSAFQEQDWPRRIFDPIPPRPDLDSKRRLRDTVARLNRSQLEPLLRFHGDGTGRAVYWELLAEVANTSPLDRQQTAG